MRYNSFVPVKPEATIIANYVVRELKRHTESIATRFTDATQTIRLVRDCIQLSTDNLEILNFWLSTEVPFAEFCLSVDEGDYDVVRNAWKQDSAA
jgi:hypothetical protein